MTYLREVLRDRRRSQRGSVLSGVLIIVAFLSIIAAAVMTELSTNFMLSESLVNRVASEATINSAAELALSQAQQTPLKSACPAPSQVTLNGTTAAASYLTCIPVVDSRSPQYVRVASSSAFTIDSTHVVLPSVGLDELLIADANARLRAFNFGDSSPRWSASVEGVLTGPPAAMVDSSESPAAVLDLVPLSDSDDTGANPNCGTNGYCVAVLREDVPGASPTLHCLMPVDAEVVGGTGAASEFSGLAYFGDTSGKLYIYSAGGEGDCSLVGQSASVGLPFVTAPIVFPGASVRRSRSDEIYLVASDGGSSQLDHFTLSQSRGRYTLQLDATLPLASPSATGIALERTTLPTELAVSFAGGQVQLVAMAADYTMSAGATRSIGEAVSRSPYWCQCPGGDVLGVGAANGLYLFDVGLNPAGSYVLNGTAAATGPSADSAGDWFLGADDGNIYEIVRQPGATSLSLGTTFGNLGAAVGSSVVTGGCPVGICVYAGLRNGDAYLVPMNARDITLTACVSSAPPSCSGVNPRVWVRAEIGVAGSPQTIRITGWSYYSP